MNISLPIEGYIINSAINFDEFLFELKVDNFIHESFELEKSKTQKLLRIIFMLERKKNIEQRSDPFNLVSSFVFILKFSNMLYPISLLVYDFKLICKIFKINSELKYLIMKQENCNDFFIDFGNIKIKEKREYLILIENLNPQTIELKSFNVLNLNKISYEIEYAISEEEIQEDSYSKNKTIISNKNNFILSPKGNLEIYFTLCSTKEETKKGHFEFLVQEVIILLKRLFYILNLESF